MTRQVKYILFISVAFAMLISVLLLSACQKKDDNYISRKDFANTLKGEWYVGGFGGGDASYSFYGDSIEYYGSPFTQFLRYSIYDSIVCTLDGIENIQYWTITESNDDLFLETQDLCGGSDSFTIDYKNQISCRQLLAPNIYVLFADIILVSQDSTATMNNFQMWIDINDPHYAYFTFYVESDGYGGYYRRDYRLRCRFI